MLGFKYSPFVQLSKIVIFVSIIASVVVYYVYCGINTKPHSIQLLHNTQPLQNQLPNNTQPLQNRLENNIQALQNMLNNNTQALHKQLQQVEKCKSDLTQMEIDEKLKGKLNFGRIQNIEWIPIAPIKSSNHEFLDENEIKVKKRMELRRKHMQEICARPESQKCSDTDIPVCSRNHIFHQYNTTTCIIKKAGSRTWLNHLQHINRAYSTVLRTFVNQPKEVVINHMLASNKIITVRHPLTRLASGYRNKFSRGNSLGKYTPKVGRITRKSRVTSWDERFYLYWMPAIFVNNKVPPDTHIKAGINKPIDPNVRYSLRQYAILQQLLKPHVTFPEFLRFVLHQYKNGNCNEHWRPLHLNCCPCFFDYQYVTKTETLNEDLAFVFKELGIPAKHSTHVGDMGSSENKDFAYYDEVPMDLRKEVYDMIKYDMDLFGYHLPENFL